MDLSFSEQRPLECHTYRVNQLIESPTHFNFSILPYKPGKENRVNFPETRTCRYRISSLLFPEALLWNNLPRYVRESHSTE